MQTETHTKKYEWNKWDGGKRSMTPNNKSRKRRCWKQGVKIYKVVSILTNK